ncbi:Uncharacterised protein [uncultured archaeon]|nr:Uncharacterised protein [uncultured archaeon]
MGADAPTGCATESNSREKTGVFEKRASTSTGFMLITVACASSSNLLVVFTRSRFMPRTMLARLSMICSSVMPYILLGSSSVFGAPSAASAETSGPQ